MLPTTYCELSYLEYIVRNAKESGHTHFSIIPIGSMAGLKFCSKGGNHFYKPSVEDMSITGDEWVKYCCNKMDMEEYLAIREKAMDDFHYKKEEE
tara:strand:+ start:388 stop:672 length:285 start_codon:yes stop_codon:yes gene_type:complete